jgi:hypothetical protein
MCYGKKGAKKGIVKNTWTGVVEKSGLDDQGTE